MPKSFVATKSITELTLDGHESYKSAWVQVQVDEQIVQTLIASFPVVEEKTYDCYGLISIHLSGLPKLIAFDLIIYEPTVLDSFQMEAPNLKKLRLHLTNLTDKWLHSIRELRPRYLQYVKND